MASNLEQCTIKCNSVENICTSDSKLEAVNSSERQCHSKVCQVCTVNSLLNQYFELENCELNLYKQMQDKVLLKVVCLK